MATVYRMLTGFTVYNISFYFQPYYMDKKEMSKGWGGGSA